ncbi:MAG: DUF4270 family protein [Bacteroidota bacterium]
MSRCLKHSPIVLIFAFTRCSFPTPLGEDIVQSEVLDIVFIDTLGVRLSTVLFDSIPTSNRQRHLIGHHTDEYFGTVTSSVYTQFSLESLDLPGETATYQYTELELIHDDYYHYDTTLLFGLYIHQLLEEMELNEENYLSNLSEFDFKRDTLLGKISTQLRPLSNREILVDIDDEYAKTIFNAALELSESDFRSEFQELFPGLVIRPDTTTNGAFYGFSPQSQLIIHYRESGEDEELVLPLNGLRFNQIQNNRSEANLRELNTIREDVTSTTTANQAYMHNGVGIAIKVEIPFLRDIRSVLQSNFITEANLILKPVKSTYSNENPLPQALIFSEVDKLNRIEQRINAQGGLFIDAEFDEDTEYRIQITDFIQEKIDEVALDEQSILVEGSPETRGITVEQLIVGDRFGEYEAKLELFILDYIIEN